MITGIQIAPSLTVKAFILCEDVRQEVRGKYSILGVFAGDVSVKNIPANIKMAWYVDFEVNNTASYQIALRAMAHGSEVAKAEGQIQIPKPGHSILLIPSFILKMDKAGTLEFNVSVNNGQRIDLDRREVIFDPSI